MARRGRPRYKSGWREENGVYYFSVTSNGMTSEEWGSNFEKKGLSVGECVKETVLSPEFLPTMGNVSEVAILDSSCLGPDDKYMKDIYRVGKARGLGPVASTEVICLAVGYIVQYRRYEWFGINIAHGPIYDEDGNLGFWGLDLECTDFGFVPEKERDYDFNCGMGFLFSVLK